VIYVNCRSQIMQQAAGADAYVIVLAAVIHHEAQHVRRGDVSPQVGEAYLELLARRDNLAGQ
jgi:hypothetical protein